MKKTTASTCFGAGAALLFCAPSAAAQYSSGANAAPEGDVPLSDIHVGASTGLATTGNLGAMFGLLHIRYRWGLLEVGGFGDAGFELFGASHAGFGATVGFAWRTSAGLRLAVCSAFGLHAYQHVGAGFLSADPGASGSTPFAGARLGASYLFGRGKNHFELGIMGLYDGDLTRRSVTVHYTESDWFNGNTWEETSTHTVGTDRFGALITVGWTRDFL